MESPVCWRNGNSFRSAVSNLVPQLSFLEQPRKVTLVRINPLLDERVILLRENALDGGLARRPIF